MKTLHKLVDNLHHLKYNNEYNILIILDDKCNLIHYVLNGWYITDYQSQHDLDLIETAKKYVRNLKC